MITSCDADWLRIKYWDEGLSTCEIAHLIGVVPSTIRSAMKRHGIPRRSQGCPPGRKPSPEARRKMSMAKRGDKSPTWKGGRRRNGDGYILIYSPDHPNANSVRCVMEHRLVMEKHLGRYLEPWERVHHKNDPRDDNRLENLQLFPGQAEHLAVEALIREKQKWQQAFYQMVAIWLVDHRRADFVRSE